MQSSGSPVVPLSLLSAIVDVPVSVLPLLPSLLALVVSLDDADVLSVVLVGDDVVGPLVLLLVLPLSVVAAASSFEPPSSGHAVRAVTASDMGMINLLRSNRRMPRRYHQQKQTGEPSSPGPQGGSATPE
jgi:hypothetical protein